MKLKLDENLGHRGQQILSAAGHDTATVAEQHLEGSLDRDLIEHCQREDRCLVTLDLDFANPFSFCRAITQASLFFASRRKRPRLICWR